MIPLRSVEFGNEGGFKEFKIGELFEGQTGDVDLQQTDINGKGHFFINSGLDNLGIKGKTDRPAKIFPANTISVDFWGNAFYRSFDYKMATHNHVFSLSGKSIKNENIGLYLTSGMSYLKQLYSYDAMGTWSKIKECKITLPTKLAGNTLEDQIDFGYMERHIRNIQNDSLNAVSQFLEDEGLTKNLSKEEETAVALFEENKIEFAEFKIGDFYEKLNLNNKKFDKRKNASTIRTYKYNVPLVNAKHGDNGIMFYGDERYFESTEMVIDIVQNGEIATGDVYPQPQRTGILWDAYLIKAKNRVDSINTLFYHSCAIHKSIKQKFCYGNKATWDRVKEEKILLPVSSDGFIDYAFMENFISAQKKLTMKHAVKWIKQELINIDILNQAESLPEEKLQKAAEGQADFSTKKN